VTERQYVYAIQAHDSTPPPNLRGFEGCIIRNVPWRRLSAVVSSVAEIEFGPTAENVLLHESVVEAVRRDGKALPVRFGTIVESDDAVRHALDERHDVLLGDLERLGDKVELGVTVLWQPPAVAAPEGPSDSLQASATAGAGTTYLYALLNEHRRERALRDKAQALADELNELVQPHTLDRRIAILPVPRLAIRATYLLEAEQSPAFLEGARKARERHPDHRYLISGPWPPYSFVTAVEAHDGADIGTLLQDAGRLLSISGMKIAKHDRTADDGR
jgi:hypothetical protein